jgi:antitoxin CptB
MGIDDTRLKRLKFRAWHRGFREADLILGPFTDTYGPTFSAEQLDALELLLEEADHDLYNWIVERDPTPAQFDGEMMNLLKTFRSEAHAVRGDDHGG